MYRLLSLIILLLCSQALLAQVSNPLSTKSKKAIELYTEADNYRVRGQFTQALALLNQALDKDKNFVEAYYRIGIIYFTEKDFVTANQYLEKGLSLANDPRKKKVFWYDLGESYFSLGKYEQSEKYLQDFLKEEIANKPKIDKAKLLLRNIQFARDNARQAAIYKQKKLSDTVNSFVLQYFPVLTADEQELVFTRRLGPGGSDDEDLVVSRKDAKGAWSVPTSISNKINSPSNEGTCTISADGRKIIFTSCLGRDGYGSCDLFESIKNGEQWSEPKNLGVGVNSAQWESQPSLSADGRTLYFVSDRRGGLGRRDIWISTLNDKGQWAQAKNAGKPINSVYDEISPFIHVNNRTLYFASNGLPGFGGYDIFFSERDTASTWSAPVNMGTPINTHEDQFSLFITADGEKGYYSHEEPRPAGYSVSYIYEIEIPEAQRVKFKSNYVKGVIRDKTTKKPLLARIELMNLEENTVESLVESDSVSGKYLMVLTQGAEYALYVNKKGYLFNSSNFNYSEIKDFKPITLDIELEKATEGTTAILQNIFFDVDKFDLKSKSKTELEKISRFLIDNPAIRVEVSGHTDNVGAVQYNKQLSERRAEAVYQYLIGSGIDAKRLVRKGYGSDKPVASNETETGRQANRRIEFKIIR